MTERERLLHDLWSRLEVVVLNGELLARPGPWTEEELRAAGEDLVAAGRDLRSGIEQLAAEGRGGGRMGFAKHVGQVVLVGALGILAGWAVTRCDCSGPVMPVVAEVPAGTSTAAGVDYARVGASEVVHPASDAVVVEDPLAVAIRVVRSTGNPSIEESRRLARLFRAAAVPCPHGAADCEPDGWTLAALAWLESGFRPWAVEGDRGVRGRGTGPGLGLMGLHRRYLGGVNPHDPAEAIPAAGVRAERFRVHHVRNCSGEPEHLWYAHYYAGWHVGGNSPAITSALEVQRRRALLRAAGGV